MDFFDTIGRWISENESLLSGMAAMIVVAGVILSPLGKAFRRIARPGTAAPNASGPAIAPLSAASSAPPHSSDEATGEAGESLKPITLQELTAPIGHPIQFAQRDGVRLAFIVRGPDREVETPVDLVISPGIVSHLHVASKLPPIRNSMDACAEFARIVVFDKRGQGLSDPTLEAPGIEERADDIGTVMDAAGLPRAVLMAYSEGGPPAVHFAHQHPDRVQGLILVGSAASWMQRPDFPIGIEESTLDLMVRGWGHPGLRKVFFPSLSSDQISDETFRAATTLMASKTSVQQIVDMMKVTDVRPLLPELRTPTLVVHFAGDLTVPVRLGRALAEGISGAEFIEAAAVDHADLTQSPEAVERVRTFCTSVASR